MRPLEVTILKTVGWGALLLLVAAIIYPFFAPVGHLPRPENVCRSHVKQTALGLVMYASDSDDRFPLRDMWMDAVFPYAKDEALFHCPTVPKGAYGYAFNGALSRFNANRLDEVGVTPLIYDSVDPIRNASDLVTSLPVPGRHGLKEDGGRNMVAYADGHVKGVSPRGKP